MTDIMPGDTVRCLVGYYKSYAYGEKATVKALDVSSSGNPVLILDNDLCDYGTSMYKVQNWQFVTRPPKHKAKQEPKKEHQIMGYQKTKFVAIKVTSVEEYFQNVISYDKGDFVTYDSQKEALDVIKREIKDNERYLILQTVALVAPAEPVVPVQITVYR